MKKLKIKAKNERAFFILLFDKMQGGWVVTKEPHKNLFGNWICKMEKPESGVINVNLN